MKNRAYLLIAMAFLLILVSSTVAMASEGPKVLIDQENINFDVSPIIRDGRTLVPVRKLVETMGGEVTWDSESQTVKILKDNKNVVLVIDSVYARVDEQNILLDVPASIVQGRTMIPLRFVGEHLGAQVVWDAQTNTINIATPINIEEEAFNLIQKVNESNRKIKQFKAKLIGTAEVTGTSGDEPMSLNLDISGDIKYDKEIPAMRVDGEAAFDFGAMSNKMGLGFILKDNMMYSMNPVTGKWLKNEIPPEEAENLKIALQAASTENPYADLFVDAKNMGAIRTVQFAGDKVVGGIDTKGVLLEFNGLKVKALLKDIINKTLAINPALSGEQLNTEDLNAAMDEALASVNFNKIKITYWIGKQDNITYGQDMEFLASYSRDGDEAAMDIDMEITLSDINRSLNIETPKENELEQSEPIDITTTFTN